MKNGPRLKEQYAKTVKAELKKELGLTNDMEIPTFKKVVINVGLGEAISDKSVLEIVAGELSLISGQKAIETVTNRAISAFKIRQGDVVGLKITLRGARMWEFIDKLINVSLPRTKDFRGLSPKAFDGSGNYSIGIEDQTIFPEIDPNTVTKLRGMEITLVTSTPDDAQARALLTKFGFPFTKDGEKV